MIASREAGRVSLDAHLEQATDARTLREPLNLTLLRTPATALASSDAMIQP
jgi:hypothetical protein